MSLFTGNDAARMIREGKSEVPDMFTAIEAGAFTFRNIDRIVIPESVVEIGNSAFRGCKNLTEVKLPEGLGEIRRGLFEGCIRLREVTIPKSVRSIGERAFLRCESLVGVVIPDGVTEIREGTFEGCKSLTAVEIPAGVTDIHKSAFKGCDRLVIVSPRDSYAHRFCNRGLFGKIKWSAADSAAVVAPVRGGEKVQAIGRFLTELPAFERQVQDGVLLKSVEMIGNTCKQIIQYTNENPAAEARIENRVADYYLPTTLKMLAVYVDAKNSTVVAEDMGKVLADICPALDGIAGALSSQLNELYKTKTTDLSADISVLNHVLKMDGVGARGVNKE